MRKSKLEIGESDEVAVRMVFDHDGGKIVEKSFTFERISDSSFKTSSITFRGYEETSSGREVVNGKNLWIDALMLLSSGSVCSRESLLSMSFRMQLH